MYVIEWNKYLIPKQNMTLYLVEKPLLVSTEERRFLQLVHDLNVLPLCLNRMFWVIVMLKDPSMTHLQWMREGDSRPRFYGTWSSPLVPQCCVVLFLSLKFSCSSTYFSTSLLDSGDGVDHFSSSQHGGQADAKEL